MTRFIIKKCVACSDELEPDQQVRISVTVHNDPHVFCVDCAEPVYRFLAKYELLNYQRDLQNAERTALSDAEKKNDVLHSKGPNEQLDHFLQNTPYAQRHTTTR